MQRPAHRPAVIGLRRHLQRGRGDLAGLLEIATVAVRARGEHQQPRPVAGRDSRGLQGPVQRGQGFAEPAGPHPALGQRPVQVNEEIRVDGVSQCALGHLLGLGRVPDPVEGVGEPADQEDMLGRARWGR
jgi:hypothetical protein